MQRSIRFVTTEWGEVAYSVVGAGPPLVFDTGWIGHLEAMWEHDGYRSLMQRMAATHEVITFDPPGTGMSDRKLTTASLDEEVAVLGAVLEAAGVRRRRTSLFCSSFAASTAIRFAANEPRAVDRMVLFGSALNGGDLADAQARAALLALLRTHWGLGSRAFLDMFIPNATLADKRWFDDWQRRSADGQTAARRLETYYESDVSSDAVSVRAPTLVIHRTGDVAVPFENGAAVASAIQDSTLTPLDGSGHLCFLGDWQQIADLVETFLIPTTAALLPKGPFGEFTARELDVAELTTVGLTNADIGERLSISPRTVESHLSSIRRKLGVGTRAEVAAWMARRSDLS